MKKIILLFSLSVCFLTFLQEWIYVSDFQYRYSTEPWQTAMFDSGQQAYAASIDVSKLTDTEFQSDEAADGFIEKVRSSLSSRDSVYFIQTEMKDPSSYILHCFVQDEDNLLSGYSTRAGQADLSANSGFYSTVYQVPNENRITLLNKKYYEDEWRHISFYPLDEIKNIKDNPYFDIYLISDSAGNSLSNLNIILENGFIKNPNGGIWEACEPYFSLDEIPWQISWLFGLSVFLMTMVVYKKRIKACMIMKIQGCSTYQIFLTEFGLFYCLLTAAPIILTGVLYLLLGSGCHFFSGLLFNRMVNFLTIYLVFVLLSAGTVLFRIWQEHRQTSLKYTQTGRDSVWLAFALLVLVLSQSVKPLSINAAYLFEQLPAYQMLKNNPDLYQDYISLCGTISRYGLNDIIQHQAEWTNLVYEQGGIMQDFMQLPISDSEPSWPTVQVNPEFLKTYDIKTTEGVTIDLAAYSEPFYLIPDSIPEGQLLNERLEMLLGTRWPTIRIKDGLTLYSHSPDFFSSHPLKVTNAIILVYPDLRVHTRTGPDFQLLKDEGETTSQIIEDFYRKTNGNHLFQMIRFDEYYLNSLLRLKSDIDVNLIQIVINSAFISVFVLYFFHVYRSVKGKELAVGALNGHGLWRRMMPLLLIEAGAFALAFAAIFFQLEERQFNTPYFRTWQQIASDMILLYFIFAGIQAYLLKRFDTTYVMQLLKGDSSK